MYKKISIFVMMAMSVLCFAMSTFRASDYALRDESIKGHYAWLCLSFLLFIVGNELCVKSKLYDIVKQIATVSMIIGIVFLVLPIIGKADLKEVNRQSYILSYLLLSFTGIFLFVRNLIVVCKESGSQKGIWAAVRKWINGYKWLLCLVFLMLLATVLQSGSEPRWDGAYLYKWLYDIRIATILNIESLSFCGHINMAYAAINVIAKYIFGSLALGMTFISIALFLGSICCVYGIIKVMWKEKSDWEYTLLTTAYAVSPFILGLVNYNYWDMWVIFLWPIIIFTAIHRKWVYHFIVAFILCFTKEPAVISYGFYCFGLMLVEILAERRNSGSYAKSLFTVLRRPIYWMMILVGAVWLCVYMTLPNWNGVGAFTFNFDYIIEKLKVFYILNFNWVLTVTAGGALLYMLKKRDIRLKILGPIVISDIAFVIFSCIFETINHARYIDTHIVVLLICAITGIILFEKVMVRNVISISLIIIMIISNYRTWDPLTLRSFENYQVGDAVMISTAEEYLSDSMVYNQQYRYFDMALDKAMKDIVLEENSVILFPRVWGRDWFFEGIYARGNTNEENEPMIYEQYWDKQRNKRILYDEDGDAAVFEICNIDVNSEADIAEILNGKTGYYFYIPCAGEQLFEKIVDQMPILDVKEFEAGGWKVIRAKL